MKKVPLTARINPALALKLEAMQKDTDKDKTACLESIMNYFFENCPDISEAKPPADQELVKALIDALQSPEVIKVIQACIMQKNAVIQLSDTTGKRENKQSVIQPCDTAEDRENKQSVTQQRDTAGKRENKQSVIQPCDTVIQDSNTQENNQIQVKPEFKSHKKQDQAGPTEEEISQAFDQTLEDLLTPQELERIKDLTPKEQEQIRESFALVSWCLQIQKMYGGSLKTASKKAGTSEASYRRKLKKLEKFNLLPVIS